MRHFDWQIKFCGYLFCWVVGMAWAYALFPFRVAQVEFGSMADWAVKGMKEVVRD